MKLKSLRKKIDDIDKKIIALLNKRASIAKNIGSLKNLAGTGIYMPDREAQIYKNILKQNKGLFSDKALTAIYREIMSSSLALEKNINIAFWGPEASFTHLAAIKKFGSQVKYSSCDSITDVFREVEILRADYGVVPVENSTEGAVSHTLDMFINSDLKICSEILLDISHNLLGKCDIKSVKKVYSNPNVLGQCRGWLDTHLRGVELIEVSTTSRAAEIASKEKGSCAIANILAAKKYKLRVLDNGIEDSTSNVTRFLVIGQHIPAPTKKDKTSIMFSTGRDRIGALHDTLSPFKKNKVNLAKIESRPSKRKSWEYYFFVDMLGHCRDAKVKKALKELEKQCSYFKILGSYPVAL
ncbi:MAG: prephenate dehydratase [Candidatus Omnitrophica bacterium]|nr:prephenate dehydratase [Candidatus Omnitrophota bacterium]MBU4148808.1 prephenate dehydratase [Candidatus Omnitrophota bacterium]